MSLLALVIWRLGMFINPSNKICCKLLWFLKIVITNLRQSFWGVLNKFGFFYWFMDSIDLIFLIYMFSLHIHTSKINIKKRKAKKLKKYMRLVFFHLSFLLKKCYYCIYLAWNWFGFSSLICLLWSCIDFSGIALLLFNFSSVKLNWILFFFNLFIAKIYQISWVESGI